MALVKQLNSGCPLDCPDLCSLQVDVTVDEAGERVSAVRGTGENPLTDGFICEKVRRFPEHMYGADRLATPLLRTGAKGGAHFRRASWDEALALVAERLLEARDAHGGESILPFNYGGSNGYLTDGALDARLFRRLGASRCLHTVCAVPTTRARLGMYGPMPGVALEDYASASLILIWGCNPHATGIHLLPRVKAARAKGAKLVVVDPRRIPLARSADLHLPIRPGTDMVVALAIIDWLFSSGRSDERFLAAHASGRDALAERAALWPIPRAAAVAGVPAVDLERLARMYADASPAVIRCGWGQERNRNGGGATAAILALPAVAGKFGVRGGGFTGSNSSPWRVDKEAMVREPETDSRAVNMNRLGRALTQLDDPPVSALFVYNCNPLATMPNQALVREGLLREDLFTVVSEQVMTDTARYADVVLPATTFLEHREIRKGYGSMRIYDAGPAAAPFAEARPNYALFAELLDRTGLARPGEPTSPEALATALAEASEHGAALAAGDFAPLPGGATQVQMVDAFPATPDGRIHLLPEALEAEAGGLYGYRDDPATDAFPLSLISPALARQVSSTFGQLHRDPASVQIHPDDAAARGVSSGDAVRIWSALGEVRCLAKVSDATRPGVLVLAKGLWAHHTTNGNSSNALSPDTLADLGGGACFNDARVQLAQEITTPVTPREAASSGG